MVVRHGLALSGGLIPEALVSDLVFDPTNPDTIYLADNSSGVYRSQDGGITWRAIKQGLELRAINALAISSDGQHLYAGSEGMGVFRLDFNEEPPAAVSTPSGLGEPTPTQIPPTVKPALPTEADQPIQNVDTPPTQKPSSGIPCISGFFPLGLIFVLPLLFRHRHFR